MEGVEGSVGGRGKKNIDKAVTQNMHEKSKKGKTKG
jgi:hypothetical protein